MNNGLYGFPESETAAGLSFLMPSTTTNNTTVFLPIHADLRLVYMSKGATLICGLQFDAHLGGNNTDLVFDLEVNGNRIGHLTAGLGGYYNTGGARYITLSALIPLMNETPGALTLVPVFARRMGSSSCSVDAGSYVHLWVGELRA